MPESQQHQLPAPAQAEPFRLLNLHMEIQDAPPLPSAQVMLALYGAPAYSLDGPKLYQTYLPPQLALQVGHGMVEVAQEAIAGANGGDVEPVDAVAPGLIVATPADAARAAAQAEAVRAMREAR
jgi:hypothetical protein